MEALFREEKLNHLFTVLRKMPWSRASQLLFLVLLLLLAQQLAGLTWRSLAMLQPASVEQWQPQGRMPAPPGQGQPTLPLDELLGLSLFGKAPPAGVAPPKAVAIDAPRTRLNVQLTGVLASNDPNRSIAIIANNNLQNSYGPGEVIDGTQARIRMIYPDRVILELQGRDETLMLDGEEYGKPLPVTPTDNTLAAARGELLSNPGKLTDYISISPVLGDGHLLGYRLNPGKNPSLFNRLGLKANDMAVSINGLDLRDNAQAMQAMQQLASASEMTVTVERDGQPHDLHVGLSEQ